MREAAKYAEKKITLSTAAVRLENTGRTIASRLDFTSNKLRVGQRWRVSLSEPRALMALKEAPHVGEAAPVTRSLEYVVEAQTNTYDLVRVTDVQTKTGVLLRLSPRRELMGVEGSALGGLSHFALSVPRFKDQEYTDTSDGIEYTGEDSFSRPVRVVWRKGEPWPALMSGAMGTATLVDDQEVAR